VATVSRVLNASAPVNSATRVRVLDAARSLRFSPNGAARSLSRRRAGALGVILPDLYGEFFSELLRGIDQCAQAAGHTLLVSSSHHDAAGVMAAVRAMRGRVDGVVIMAPEIAATALRASLPDGLPAVLLNSTLVDPLPSISVDNVGGARQVVRHLVSLGHERIGFICGPARNAEAKDRLKGYRAGLETAGLSYDDRLVVRGDFTEEGGSDSVQRMLSDPACTPSAIFAANDAMAVGALSALREARFDVPGRMAVVGFDDIPVARFLGPPLTTVRVNIAALGARAAALLLSSVSERPPPDAPLLREVLPTELVVRSSCGASRFSKSSRTFPSPMVRQA